MEQEGPHWRGAKLIFTGLAETDDAASFCCALFAEIGVARALIRAAERRQSIAWRVNARRVRRRPRAASPQRYPVPTQDAVLGWDGVLDSVIF